MSKYYELMDDRYHPGRWHLRSPVDEKGGQINPWQFFKGKQIDLQGTIRFPGVQFIPAQVEGHAGPFFILNTLRSIHCIDDARCEEVHYWKPEDGQPEKVGMYRVVAGLRIAPSKVGDARIFRTWGWSLGLIISEDIKPAMEAEDFTGTWFVEV